MLPFSDMAEKIRERAAGLVSGINPGGLWGRAKDLAAGAPAALNGLEEKLWAPLPGGFRQKLPWLKGKLVLALAALVFALTVCLTVLAAGLSGEPAPAGPVPEAPSAGAGAFNPVPIPPEDLFLPEEPDFLPPVILERERREAWTAEDAEPFWYDPLEEGGEAWREMAEKIIDDLLERVP